MYDYLNPYRDYQFGEKYRDATLVLVQKHKDEIMGWNQCFYLFFDKSHCSRKFK